MRLWEHRCRYVRYDVITNFNLDSYPLIDSISEGEKMKKIKAGHRYAIEVALPAPKLNG